MSLEGPRKSHNVDRINTGYSTESSGKKEEKLDTSKLVHTQNANQAYIEQKNGNMEERSFKDLTKKPPLGKSILGPNPNIPLNRMGR